MVFVCEFRTRGALFLCALSLSVWLSLHAQNVDLWCLNFYGMLSALNTLISMIVNGQAHNMYLVYSARTHTHTHQRVFIFQLIFMLRSAEQTEECPGQTIGNSFRFFFFFFHFMHSAYRRATPYWLVIWLCVRVHSNKNACICTNAFAVWLLVLLPCSKRTRTIHHKKIYYNCWMLFCCSARTFLLIFLASERLHPVGVCGAACGSPSTTITSLRKPNTRLIVCFACSFDSQFHSFIRVVCTLAVANASEM